MANTLLTIGQITRESLRVLVNETTFTRQISRDYNDQFGKEGAKIGTVLNVRKPPRFTNTTGQGLQLQDVTEQSVPVTLTTQYQRSFVFSTANLVLDIDDFSKRFIRPAVVSLANQVDFDGLNQYLNIYNEIGTPGQVPNTTLTYLQAMQRLDEESVPRDERCFVISPAMMATAVDTVKGLFNPQATIGDYSRKGMIAKEFLGADWYMDQNTRTQTVGLQGGAPVVSTAGQTGASLTTTGWSVTTQVLNQGDVITIAGVHAVNPLTFQSTGALRQFVVTANVTSGGGGAATVPISPSIVTSGPFQNVDAANALNSVLSVQGAASTNSPRGLAFHPEAFTFANADLELPGGVDMADRVADKELGLSIRAVRAYDINTDRFPLRLDLLGGWATLYPQFACRIAS